MSKKIKATLATLERTMGIDFVLDLYDDFLNTDAFAHYAGGLGGGGRGGVTGSIAGTYLPNGENGTANTGGGGGGKGRQQDSTGAGTFRGGTGGSGVCKIRYAGSGSIFNAGSASYNGGDGYTYVTFTASVSFKNF